MFPLSDWRTGGFALVAIFVAALGLAACSKNNQSEFSPRWDGAGPVPYGGGVYKVGNPYQIAGRTYYPREDTTYDETGTASWYGELFDRRQTANGEWFDMTRLTAAHPTLPMPIYARVTNLGNNRSIVVRINDRGPYASNRIIDLSRAAARELGFERQGTAQVRVQYLSRASLNDDGSELVAMNEQLRNGTLGRVQNASASPAATGQSREANAGTGNGSNARGTTTNFATSAAGQADSSLTTGSIGTTVESATANGGTVTVNPASGAGAQGADTRYFVQAASFSNRNNATTLQERLRHIGNVLIDTATAGDRTFYRVRVGPLDDPLAAERALGQVKAAGHQDARIVSN